MGMGVFGSLELWPDEDAIAYSDQLNLDLILEAYRSGVFPMPGDTNAQPDTVFWWSPQRRAIIELDEFRCSRSLRKSARHYTTSVDANFREVIRRCGDPARPDGWIDDQIMENYIALAEQGYAHSIETWNAEGELVGGLYGVGIGGLFAGESMFHDPKLGRDASKVALVRLVEILRGKNGNATLLDAQWLTPHLKRMGAKEISRSRYLALLVEALKYPDVDWSAEASRSARSF